MKTVSEGIVLHMQKYTDKSSILHVYTRDYGRMTYMVYGKRGKNNEYFLASEPFSLVEIEANHVTGRDIQTLEKISFSYINNGILQDIRKRSVAVFISEILYRTLRHPEPDTNLFDYLKNVVKTLNESVSSENIHLRFLVDYTYYLGIMPELDQHGMMLDITTGLLIKPCEMDNCFSVEETNLLIDLYKNTNIQIDRITRQTLLDKLCLYYECHLPDFFSPKSLDVLKEVFD